MANSQTINKALEQPPDAWTADKDKILAAIRQHGLTLVQTANAYHLMRLGEVKGDALEQPERVNQCGETCERAKLCAVCARGLNEQPDQPCKRCNAYATLVKAQEKQLSHYRGQANKYREAIDTLHSERQANATLTEELEQFRAQNAQPQQEPVAWRNVLPGGRKTDEWESARVADYNQGWNDYRKAATAALEKLHNTQPRREWVGLTDDDIQQVRENCGITHHAIKTIEAKLKEKNYGAL